MKRRTLTQVIAEIAADGVEFFTIQDLQQRFQLDRTQAYGLAHRLAAANLVWRVRRGLYAVAGPRDWHGGPALGMDWYWVAANAVGDERHYLAYYTAMEIHDMLQHPLRTVFIAVMRPHRDFDLGKTRIRFVRLAEARFFGDEQRRISGHVINIAQLERTFLDCVDRPELCGGIQEVVRGFARRHRDLDADRLVRFAQRFRRPVATKRLGYLLELAGYGDREVIWELEQVAGRLGKYVPLDKGKSTMGAPRDRRWELAINVDPRQLLKASRT